MLSAVHAVARCLSVCLSVTLVYCIETTDKAIKQLALDCSGDSSLRKHGKCSLSLGDVGPLSALHRRGALKSCDVIQICSYIS